ncbi:hypothetical protein [Polaribacter sp. R77954]|uniref:hypothetical protein n=1 Tax=Polaribacter sp. R77954 TaxID=3093870 RepID=UPI0037C8E20A
MEEEYNYLIELTQQGTLEMKESLAEKDIQVFKNGKNSLIEKGIWKNQRFLKKGQLVGERNTIYLPGGKKYKDDVILYNPLK